MTQTLPLSVLDFESNFHAARDLGPFVESLGYRRYWFAEHQPQPQPELFVALLAGLTTNLRVGTGGVLLRLRTGIENSLNFGFLARTFGDRIDAGFCVGVPSFGSEVIFGPLVPLGPEFEHHAGRWINRLETSSASPPQVWSLGTGRTSAERAARFGVGYAYSLFHSFSVDDPAAVGEYRRMFRASSRLVQPRVMLGFAGLCAPTDEEAARRLSLHDNPAVQPRVFGSPATCRRRLANVVAQYRPNELIVLDLSPSLEEKQESYELWADVVRLLNIEDEEQRSFGPPDTAQPLASG